MHFNSLIAIYLIYCLKYMPCKQSGHKAIRVVSVSLLMKNNTEKNNLKFFISSRYRTQANKHKMSQSNSHAYIQLHFAPVNSFGNYLFVESSHESNNYTITHGNVISNQAYRKQSKQLSIGPLQVSYKHSNIQGSGISRKY